MTRTLFAALLTCLWLASGARGADPGGPTTRTVAVKDGLQMAVEVASPEFKEGDDLAFTATFTNVSDKPFKLSNPDWIDTWQIIVAPEGGGGPWQAFYIGPKREREGLIRTLKPGESVAVAAKVNSDEYEYRWIGESFAPVKPRKHLPAARYALSVTVTLGSTPDDNRIPYWSGKIESKALDIVIAPGAK